MEQSHTPQKGINYISLLQMYHTIICTRLCFPLIQILRKENPFQAHIYVRIENIIKPVIPGTSSFKVMQLVNLSLFFLLLDPTLLLIYFIVFTSLQLPLKLIKRSAKKFFLHMYSIFVYLHHTRLQAALIITYM